MIAMAHMGIPAVFVNGGTITPDHLHGRELTVVSAFEAVGEHAAHVLLALDDFEAIRRRTPVRCDLKPIGRYVATDLDRAGGVRQVMRRLLDARPRHGDARTMTGRPLGEALTDVPPTPRGDQVVVRPVSAPVFVEGHLAVLRGNLAQKGAVAKFAALASQADLGAVTDGGLPGDGDC